MVQPTLLRACHGDVWLLSYFLANMGRAVGRLVMADNNNTTCPTCGGPCDKQPYPKNHPMSAQPFQDNNKYLTLHAELVKQAVVQAVAKIYDWCIANPYETNDEIRLYIINQYPDVLGPLALTDKREGGGKDGQ